MQVSLDLVPLLGRPLLVAFAGAGITLLVSAHFQTTQRLRMWFGKSVAVTGVATALQLLLGMIAVSLISIPWVYLMLLVKIPIYELLGFIFGIACAAFFLRTVGLFRFQNVEPLEKENLG